MLNLNRAMILGNATRAPEMRYTPNGQAVVNFAVATNRRWKSQAGDMQEKAEFHEVVAWGKLAEISNQIIQKGARVYVEGRLQTRNWEAPDGSRRQRTEIIAENIIALSAKGEYDDSSTDSSSQEPAPAPEKKSEPKKDSKESTSSKSDEDEINLDDIPF